MPFSRLIWTELTSAFSLACSSTIVVRSPSKNGQLISSPEVPADCGPPTPVMAILFGLPVADVFAVIEELVEHDLLVKLPSRKES